MENQQNCYDITMLFYIRYMSNVANKFLGFGFTCYNKHTKLQTASKKCVFQCWFYGRNKEGERLSYIK